MLRAGYAGLFVGAYSARRAPVSYDVERLHRSACTAERVSLLRGPLACVKGAGSIVDI
jgi:hypothetical protein